ncbi:uncharacterized protein LOC112461776 [Temnothorax curvispinosus]|uniref:Uncharacterized protein LOC112461776 n=1 Tax=Temnothorax curvispinosus TaxID=300111 RepID=A0A6J1QQU9_9HYME|nr:uncharacterized protein LOC112461776 [Temnothorax curvispinosus]
MFQRLLDTVLGSELELNVFVCLDVIVRQIFDEYLCVLQKIFHCLRKTRPRLNPDKCRFCVNRINYIGHLIYCEEDIRIDLRRSVPSQIGPSHRTYGKTYDSSCEWLLWYCRFTERFAIISVPLIALTRKLAK